MGADLDQGEFIRTTTKAKPGDADGNNVYGTAGYQLYAVSPIGTAAGNNSGPTPYNPAYNAVSLPSYVSAITQAPNTQLNWGAGQVQIDNPALTPGSSVANVLSGMLISRSVAGQTPIATITLTGTVPANFRIGILADVSGSIWDVPSELQITSSNGDVSGINCVAVGDLVPDVYFFNVAGGKAGDVLTVYVTNGGKDSNGNSYNFPGISGFFFDNPAAAPSTLTAQLSTATQTFFDDFLGTDLNSAVWNRNMRFPHINGAAEKQAYLPSNVTVANGLCTIRVKKEPTPVNNYDYQNNPTGGGTDNGLYDYSSGALETYSKWTQPYGYFEAKIRCATGPGCWPAFWLMPDRGPSSPDLIYRTATGNSYNGENFPMGNEIDVLEYMSTWKNTSTGLSKAHAGAIWQYGLLGASFGDYTDVGQLVSPDTQFHTYGVMWAPGSLTYYIDGNVVMTGTSPNVAVCPMYMILNCALSNDDWSGGGPTDAQIQAGLPCTMDIDYVKVYTLPGTGSGGGGTVTNMAVTNNSFESSTGTTIPGWTVTASGGYGSGATVVNNPSDQTSQYPNFSNPLPGTGDANNYLALTGYDGNTAEAVIQNMGTLQPNTTYTLTVAIGVGRYSAPNNGYIALVNGTSVTSTQLASANMNTLGFGNYANNFKDLTVSYTTGATVSGNLGIVIATTHGYPSSSFAAIDNVRMTSQAAVPTPVAVTNNSFESSTGTTIPGWTVTSSGGYGSGATVVNNPSDQTSQYPNFSNPLPGTGDANNYLALTGYDGNSAESVFQDMGTLQPNTTYTLTVAVGVGRYSAPNNGYIALVNGTATSNTWLASANMSTLNFSNYANNFKDLTVTFTTGATVSGHLGIVIATTHGYPSSSFAAVDNVRLTKK